MANLTRFFSELVNTPLQSFFYRLAWQFYLCEILGDDNLHASYFVSTKSIIWFCKLTEKLTRVIGHFQIPRTFTFKTRLRAKPLSFVMKMSHLRANETSILQICGFALRLALKQRLETTRKRPIAPLGISLTSNVSFSSRLLIFLDRSNFSSQRIEITW